jgi:DsbC/DsbD-like thiol-disulfide interchange protein
MRILALLLMAGLSSAAHAGETPWQELAPGTKARLISSDVLNSDGTTAVALEVDMPQSSNTYWRVPGETGIPTELDFTGSMGIAGHQIVWPYPTIETQTGYVDFVYRGPVVLPVEVKLDGQHADLKVAVTMGICSDVCVPVRASFELPLSFAAPDRSQALRIKQALAFAPLDWEGGGDPIPFVTYDLAADALAVSIGPEIDPASIIADAGLDGQLFGAPQKSPEPNLVLVPLLGGDQGRGVEGKPVRLTFMTEMGPFSVERQVAPAESTTTGN